MGSETRNLVPSTGGSLEAAMIPILISPCPSAHLTLFRTCRTWLSQYPEFWIQVTQIGLLFSRPPQLSSVSPPIPALRFLVSSFQTLSMLHLELLSRSCNSFCLRVLTTTYSCTKFKEIQHSSCRGLAQPVLKNRPEAEYFWKMCSTNDCPLNKALYYETGDTSSQPLTCLYPVKVLDP